MVGPREGFHTVQMTVPTNTSTTNAAMFWWYDSHCQNKQSMKTYMPAVIYVPAPAWASSSFSSWHPLGRAAAPALAAAPAAAGPASFPTRRTRTPKRTMANLTMTTTGTTTSTTRAFGTSSWAIQLRLTIGELLLLWSPDWLLPHSFSFSLYVKEWY